MTTPLLIGGATTSRVHTAVKIAPAYSGPVVHVADASRAVGVAGALLDTAGRDAYAGRVRAEYAAVRREREGRTDKRATAPDRGRAREPVRGHVAGARRREPTFLGVRAFTRVPARGARRAHRLDAVLRDLGAARRLPGDPRPTRAWAPRRATCSATRRRCWTGSSREDLLGRGRSSASGRRTRRPTTTSSCSRTRRGPARPGGSTRSASRWPSPTAGPNVSVADWVGAGGRPGPHRHVRRHRGPRVDELVATFEAAHDDYSAILAKALADRLAEALAERMHERVRRELWGYAPDETLSNDDLIARALPGHPAGARLPGHAGPPRQGDAVRAAGGRGAAGIQLTESMAMLPGGVGVGALPVAPGLALLRDRADRARPARGLRAPRRHAARGGRALALAEPRGRRLREPCLTASSYPRAHDGTRDRSGRAASRRSSRSCSPRCSSCRGASRACPASTAAARDDLPGRTSRTAATTSSRRTSSSASGRASR